MEHRRAREIREAAKKAGVEITEMIDKGKHIKVVLGNGRFVTCGRTPSDTKSNLNLAQDMRKEGRGENPRRRG